jgi:hypothetical protein
VSVAVSVGDGEEVEVASVGSTVPVGASVSAGVCVVVSVANGVSMFPAVSDGVGDGDALSCVDDAVVGTTVPESVAEGRASCAKVGREEMRSKGRRSPAARKPAAGRKNRGAGVIPVPL